MSCSWTFEEYICQHTGFWLISHHRPFISQTILCSNIRHPHNTKHDKNVGSHLNEIIIALDMRQIENAFNKRRTLTKIARNSVFDCHFSPVGRQIAIENSVSNYFDLRSSIVLTFFFWLPPIRCDYVAHFVHMRSGLVHYMIVVFFNISGTLSENLLVVYANNLDTFEFTSNRW